MPRAGRYRPSMERIFTYSEEWETAQRIYESPDRVRRKFTWAVGANGCVEITVTV